MDTAPALTLAVQFPNQYEANTAWTLARDRSFYRYRRRIAALVGALIIIVTIVSFWIISSSREDDARSPSLRWWEKFLVVTNLSQINATREALKLLELASICKNSQQGMHLIADDQGVVCDRQHLESKSGCCNRTATSSVAFSCASCTANTHCCRVFEFCIACCMRTENRAFLERVVTTEGAHARELPSVKERFEPCIALCRTNSASVVNEHRYKDAYIYCFSDHQPRRKVRAAVS